MNEPSVQRYAPSYSPDADALTPLRGPDWPLQVAPADSSRPPISKGVLIVCLLTAGSPTESASSRDSRVRSAPTRAAPSQHAVRRRRTKRAHHDSKKSVNGIESSNDSHQSDVNKNTHNR